MSTALVTIVPYMALQLSSYELMKGFYMVFRSTYLEVGVVGGVADKERMGMLPSTMIGALAGGMSKIMTLPLDL